MHNEQRRNYFIDKKFQFRFILKFCLVTVLASIVIGALVYMFNLNTTTVAFENLRVVVKSTSDFIMPAVLIILMIVTGVTAIIIIGVTLFTSHKIAGPLFKLNKELGKIKEKDLTSPIRIRSADQLQRIAATFEEMRLEYNKTMKEIKLNLNYIVENSNELKSATENVEVRKKLSDCIDRIENEIKEFKTD